jgi:hypothetical protein
MVSFFGTSPTKTTQKATVKLGPEQQKIFGLAFPYAQQYAATPPQMYGGTGIAGFTAPEQQAQQQQLGMAGNLSGMAGSAAGANQLLMNPQFMLDPASNPYYRNMQDVITRGMTENLTQSILPQIRNAGTAAGGMYSGGSTRQGIAEGGAIGNTAGSIADALTRMYAGAYESGMGRLGDAINRNQQVMAQQLFGPELLRSVGLQQREMEQARLDESIRQFYTQQQLPFIRAQELLGLIQQMPGATSVTTGTQSGGQPGLLNSVLGGAATGLSLAAMGPLGAAMSPMTGALVGGGAGLLGSLGR